MRFVKIAGVPPPTAIEFDLQRKERARLGGLAHLHNSSLGSAVQPCYSLQPSLAYVGGCLSRIRPVGWQRVTLKSNESIAGNRNPGAQIPSSSRHSYRNFALRAIVGIAIVTFLVWRYDARSILGLLARERPGYFAPR